MFRSGLRRHLDIPENLEDQLQKAESGAWQRFNEALVSGKRKN